MQATASRAVNAVSLGELQRRWHLVRERMQAQGIDALVMQNSSDWIGGYVRWFSNRPATNGYPSTIVFPLEEGMSLIEQGPFGGQRVAGEAEWQALGIARRLTTPSYASVHYSGAYDAEIVAAELARLGAKRVGFVSPSATYHSFGEHLRNGAGGCYAELSRIFVLGRASQELRDAHEAVLAAQRHALTLLKPGAACADIFAQHNAWLLSQGMNEERRISIHGMDCDMVERPLIRHDETMAIEEHMAIVVHPGLLNERLFVHNTELYPIEGDGPGPWPALHATADLRAGLKQPGGRAPE